MRNLEAIVLLLVAIVAYLCLDAAFRPASVAPAVVASGPVVGATGVWVCTPVVDPEPECLP